MFKRPPDREVSRAVSIDRTRSCTSPFVTLNTHHFVRGDSGKCLTYLSVQAGCSYFFKEDPVCFSYNTQLTFINCTKNTDGETWPVTITDQRVRESINTSTHPGNGWRKLLQVSISFQIGVKKKKKRLGRLTRGVPVSQVSCRGSGLVRTLACWLMYGFFWALPSSLNKDLNGSDVLRSALLIRGKSWNCKAVSSFSAKDKRWPR